MQGKNTLVIATDGSKKAVSAFRYSCDLFKRCNNFSQIIALSIIDPNKQYQITDYQPKHLEESLKNSLLSRFPQSKYSIIMRRKEVDSKSDVLKVAKQQNAGLLAMGFHGRKSDSSTGQGKHTLLGSAVQHGMTYSSTPLLVCKLDYKEKDKRVFAVCLDGSRKSIGALEFVLKIAAPEDQIVALYAPLPSKPKEQRDKIEEAISHYKNVKYIELPPSNDPTVTLIRYINDDPTYTFDYVLIGCSGVRAQAQKQKLVGRTARKVLLEANSNIIMFP